MANENKATPVPPSVQAKMQRGERQRHAMGTTPSANPEKERKR